MIVSVPQHPVFKITKKIFNGAKAKINNSKYRKPIQQVAKKAWILPIVKPKADNVEVIDLESVDIKETPKELYEKGEEPEWEIREEKFEFDEKKWKEDYSDEYYEEVRRENMTAEELEWDDAEKSNKNFQECQKRTMEFLYVDGEEDEKDVSPFFLLILRLAYPFQ